MKRYTAIVLIAAVFLSGCGAQTDSHSIGPGSNMSMRHHASVPDEYAELKIPDISDTDISKGGELYVKFCVSCHGDGGMGDGPAAAALDPAPAPVAHTSSMLSDGYLYWRIAEGGAEFKSTMPAWKDSLNTDEIWAVIAYMRTLGSPADDAALHGDMLEKAVNQNIVTRSEADTFLLVHDELDAYRTAHQSDMPQDDADEIQAVLLDELVNAGKVSRAQADDFARVHQLLLDAGLME